MKRQTILFCVNIKRRFQKSSYLAKKYPLLIRLGSTKQLYDVFAYNQYNKELIKVKYLIWFTLRTVKISIKQSNTSLPNLTSI